MEIYPSTASLSAGYCGDCREPVRLGETCCDEVIGWIAPDGLAWESYDEYVIAVAAGRMLDARGGHGVVPDSVLALDSEHFMAAKREADYGEWLRFWIARDLEI